jgi:hypothetical protein
MFYQSARKTGFPVLFWWHNGNGKNTQLVDEHL